ncbi:ATP-binding protein [Muricoprocola aceti]|uniref:ATP-binding protein n=1 Tax=Muricoprocola aceti TaxID=2981772 RepID=UPI002F3F4FD8
MFLLFRGRFTPGCPVPDHGFHLSVILNTNLEFSQWVNALYDQRMTTALIGRLTHHVELILFPGINNRLRESSINETLSKINSQNG